MRTRNHVHDYATGETLRVATDDDIRRATEALTDDTGAFEDADGVSVFIIGPIAFDGTEPERCKRRYGVE